MKISNKRELQQIGINRSSDIDFQYFTNLYKKCTAKPQPLFVIDTTLASDNSSSFRKNIKTNYDKFMIKLNMKKYNTILIEKQQKYQHYHQVKLINMNLLQMKEYYRLIKVE